MYEGKGAYKLTLVHWGEEQRDFRVYPVLDTAVVNFAGDFLCSDNF